MFKYNEFNNGIDCFALGNNTARIDGTTLTHRMLNSRAYDLVKTFDSVESAQTVFETRETLANAAKWLGFTIANGYHESACLPRHAILTLKMIESQLLDSIA